MKTRHVLTLSALLPVLAACAAKGGRQRRRQPDGRRARHRSPGRHRTGRRNAGTGTGADRHRRTGTAGRRTGTGRHAAAGPGPGRRHRLQVIPNGQPFQPAAGKIEVTEIFGYVCPACAAFQPGRRVGRQQPAT
jgi:thiol:disulfide interchange protein DsbA